MTRYRVGRHLGRTIYRVVPNDLNLISEDELIGIMDTPELGALVVEALNDRERVLAAQGTSALLPPATPHHHNAACLSAGCKL